MNGTDYVTYFDEMKAMPASQQNWYIVAGIAVPMREIGAIEEAVSVLSDKTFGTRDLTPATEFHASHIYHGKGPFKGMLPAKRLEILEALADIIASNGSVRRIYAAIDTSRLYEPKQAPEFAFAHFCERVQMMTGHKSTSILIGDRDDEQLSNMVRDFSQFRTRGTPWQYGIEIKSIVDSVHFTRSHHSRMMQLADSYVFIIGHWYGSKKGRMAESFTDALKRKDLHAHRYKHWPN
jgi:hypothetical protein